MIDFQLFWVNCDWYHIWGNALPEHLIHDFTHVLSIYIYIYIYIHYILLNLSVLGLCLRINDSDLFAWISLAAMYRTYFSKLFQCIDIVIKYPWYQ